MLKQAKAQFGLTIRAASWIGQHAKELLLRKVRCRLEKEALLHHTIMDTEDKHCSFCVRVAASLTTERQIILQFGRENSFVFNFWLRKSSPPSF